MKSFFIFITLITSIFAEIEPEFIYKSNGYVIDFVYDKDSLYVATDSGIIDIFKNDELNSSIEIPKIEDFFGEVKSPKIFSVDVIDKKILILSQGETFRELYIYEDKLIKIISDKDRLFIKEARFIDENTLLLALMSSEIILYNLKTNKQIYKIQLSQSSFSDFELNEDKSKVAVSFESGEIKIVEVKSGKVIKTLKGANVDNVYKVDYKNGFIIGAGQDRRVSIYNENSGESYYKEASFLIYACSLSPSAKLGAYAYNEKNDIAIFDTKTKERKAILKGHKSTLNKIWFLSEDTIFSSSDDENIIKWRIK